MLFRKHVQLFVVSPLILGIIFIVVSIYVQSWRSFEARVAATEQTEKPTETEVSASFPQFLSNEILIKVKKEAKGKVKEGNPSDTGISTIDDLGKDKKIKRFEKVVSESKTSQTDAEIFAWYKIELDEEQYIIKGAADNDQGFSALDHPMVGGIAALLERLKKDESIEAAEPNFIVTTTQLSTPSATLSPEPTPTGASTPSDIPPTSIPTLFPSATPLPTVNPVPNDPYYSTFGSWGQSYADLYGLKKMRMEGAWSSSTGSSNVVVASVDTGVDRFHEDISSNMWVNSDETPGNGIDDDANGYIDDYFGWDFYNNDNDPMDDHGHGSHTAGTIAAVGNNSLGVVGVNWTARIMALKFLGSGGSGTLDGAARALRYAADNGAAVSNNSWGCACQSTLVDDAISYAHGKGMVTVVSAGNSNANALDQSPASSDRAITVAASDYNDAKAGFSNWGEKIDVAAPGVETLSLKAAVSPMCSGRIVGTNYCRVSGTSMSGPHVAGLAALLLSRNPALTNEEIRQLIRRGAIDLGSAGKDQYYGYGRIDAGNSMGSVLSAPLTPIITNPKSRTTIYGTAQYNVIGSIPGQNFSRYTVEVGAGRLPTNWTRVVESTNQITNGTLAVVDWRNLSEGTNIIRLTAYDTYANAYQFQVHDIFVKNFDAEIITPSDLAPIGTSEIFGNAATLNDFILQNYLVEWGSGATPSTYSSAGITMINNSSPIRDNLLATWDTSALTDGQTYTLRLTVTATNGASKQTVVQVKMDKDLVSRWPKRIHTGSLTAVAIMPVVTDVDGDGVEEIIYGDPGIGKINAVHKDGTNLAGFPASTDPGYSVRMPVTVDDIDGDGKKEIIASQWLNGTSYRIYHKFIVIRFDGVKYPGWTMNNNILCDGYNECIPSIADINLDGKKDIVFLDRDGLLHAYQLNGTEIAGFPKQVMENTSIGAGVAIDDLDNDGVPEIAAARFRWVTGFPGKVYLFDNQGNLLPGWPYVSPLDGSGNTLKFDNTIGVGDIDGDGAKEFYTIGNYLQPMCNNCSYKLYGWKKDGTVVSGFPKDLGTVENGSPYSGPQVADIDSDGKDELILATMGLKVYNQNGIVISESAAAQSASSGGVSIADVDGDGKLEFATYGGKMWSQAYGSGVFLLDDSGVKIWERKLPNQGKVRFEAPVSIGDMDGNGKAEFVAIRAQNFYSDMSYGYVYLWEIPATGAARDHWTMVGYEPRRTNRTAAKGNFGPTPTPILSNTPIPTFTSTPIPTLTPTLTPTPTITSTPTLIPTNTVVPTPTLIPTNTVVPTPTEFPVPTFTPTQIPNPTPADSIPPTVSITRPKDGSRVRPNSIVSISAKASDNVAVSRVEFFINGTHTCTDFTPTSYTCTWQVPATRSITYALTAVAFDTTGNSASHAISVTAR